MIVSDAANLGEQLGRRVAWARMRMGLTLEDLGRRTGITKGYISHLENGSKTNPTLSCLLALASSLSVSVGFLLGEIVEPLDATVADNGSFLDSFRLYLQRMPELAKVSSTYTVEERFKVAVEFLLSNFPERFSRASLAFQLGLTLRGFNDVLDRDCDVSTFTLQQLSGLMGIDTSFFLYGQMAVTPKVQVGIESAVSSAPG